MAAGSGSSSSSSSSAPKQTMTPTVQALSEREPLLSSPAGANSHDNDASADNKTKQPHHARVFNLCLILIALVQGANALLVAPLTHLKELALCKSYYGPSWSLGRDCRVEPVQSGLETLIGWQQLFDCLPGILLGIFYGIMADRYGRRLVLALALAGLTVGVAWTEMVLWWSDVFPVKLTWLSSAFSLAGGGPIVGNSLIFVVAADVTPEEQRASNFFCLYAVALLTEMILSSLSSMQIQPWWLARLGLVALLMAVLTVWIILPETAELPKASDNSKTGDSGEATLLEEEDEEEDDPVVLNDDVKNTIWRRASAGFMSQLQDLRFIWASRQPIPLLLVFVVGMLYRSSVGTLYRSLLGPLYWSSVEEYFPQYVSNRYGWRESQAEFLLSYGATVHLILLAVILPGLNDFILRRGRDARTKDLWLARGSAVSIAVGALAIGLSPSVSLMVVGLTLFVLGQGFVPVVLSLATSLVELSHVGMLYTAMAVSETIGRLVNGPILSSTFDAGMRVGGALMGLPFLVAGAMLAMAATAVFAVRLPSPNYNDQDLLGETLNE
ncbi:hypothetical protein VTN77DRAFT_9727 [Rasamsonia byssochlamydoides]|uniref:uncharacterized protein n=1 Tax=Rasamsonia byssochlamydoides TaxID=89139 RepID=UPI0037425F0D